MINLKTICKTKPFSSKTIVKYYLDSFNSRFGTKVTTRKLFLLVKIQHQVYGTGHHCLKKRHILKTSTSFFGEKYESLRTEHIKLTRDECYIMVKSKKCNEFQMECEHDYCSYSSNPIANFKWMNEVTTEKFSCTTTPKLITANSPDDLLFNGKCKVSDRECSLKDSIIVWDATIYHECPLYKIAQETFNIELNSDILISNTREQPIKFTEDNYSRTGFLTQNGIIKVVSDIVPLNKIIQYLQLSTINKTIIRQRHVSYIANDYQIQFLNLDLLANNIREPLLSHNSLLMESTDLLYSFQEV
ncbi:unnamed protein product, partial [Brachionus calyciflorus]